MSKVCIANIEAIKRGVECFFDDSTIVLDEPSVCVVLAVWCILSCF